MSAFILYALIYLFAYKTLSIDIVPQFFLFLVRFFTGQWGISSIFNTEISSFIWLNFLSSSILGLICLIGSFFLGLVLSYWAIRWSKFSALVQIFLLGTPVTVWAIIINDLFYYSSNFGLIYKDLYISQFILPAVVITLYHSSIILQMNFFFFKTEANKEYYQLLMYRSLNQFPYFFKYLCKPNLSVIVRNLTLKVCILLGGSVGIENFFHIPGLGFITRKSIIQKDINLLLASSFLILVFITITYFLLDLIQKALEKGTAYEKNI